MEDAGGEGVIRYPCAEGREDVTGAAFESFVQFAGWNVPALGLLDDALGVDAVLSGTEPDGVPARGLVAAGVLHGGRSLLADDPEHRGGLVPEVVDQPVR